jgi:hypothetical protein
LISATQRRWTLRCRFCSGALAIIEPKQDRLRRTLPQRWAMTKSAVRAAGVKLLQALFAGGVA